MLYHENTFIVVSHEVPMMQEQMKRFFVPVVSSHYIARVKEHLIRIHLVCENQTCFDHDAYLGCYRCGDAPCGALLILAADLNRFCRFCRIQNHLNMAKRTPVIRSRRGQQLSWTMIRKSTLRAKTMIQFRETTYGKASRAQQLAFLAPFRDLTSTWKISITGALDTSLVAEVTRSMMAPRLLWGYAVGWDLVHLMFSLKRDVDRARITATGLSSLKSYTFLFNIMSKSFLLDQHALLEFSPRSPGSCCDWDEILARMQIEVGLNLSELCHKAGQDPTGLYILEICFSFLATLQHLPTYQLVKLYHLNGIHDDAVGYHSPQSINSSLMAKALAMEVEMEARVLGPGHAYAEDQYSGVRSSSS